MGRFEASVVCLVRQLNHFPVKKAYIQLLLAVWLVGFTGVLGRLIELNEAFAAQSLACIRAWGLADDDSRINPNGGAIALGHPLGMSGARIPGSAAIELHEQDKRFALITMCIGVGQGFAVVIEKA